MGTSEVTSGVAREPGGDRAVGCARERLRMALIELGERESVQRIQVRELCARAGVSRSGFYRHFTGMPDYLDRVVDDFVDEMNGAFYFGNVYIHLLGVDPLATFRQCVDFMLAHERFVRVMIGRNGTPELQRRVTRMWGQQLEEALVLRAPELQGSVNFEILACYVSSAMWGMLEWSIANRDKYSPDYMARQMSHLVYDCTLGSLLESGTRAAGDD